MTKMKKLMGTMATLFLISALALGASTMVLAQDAGGGQGDDAGTQYKNRHRGDQTDDPGHQERDVNGRDRDKGNHGGEEKVLYNWVQDQAHVAPDFLAVIDFDEHSSKYGEVINVVPLPPPGNTGNEPHHCH